MSEITKKTGLSITEWAIYGFIATVIGVVLTMISMNGYMESLTATDIFGNDSGSSGTGYIFGIVVGMFIAVFGQLAVMVAVIAKGVQLGNRSS